MYLVPIELSLSSVRPIAYQFHSFSGRSFIPSNTPIYVVFDNARLFENLPGKRFNKIIIIYLVVNEIIREMVYFRNDTNIPYEK